MLAQEVAQQFTPEFPQNSRPPWVLFAESPSEQNRAKNKGAAPQRAAPLFFQQTGGAASTQFTSWKE